MSIPPEAPDPRPPSRPAWVATLAVAGLIGARALLPTVDHVVARAVGVLLIALSLPLWIPPFALLSRYGAPHPGGGFVHTTRLVERGLYRVVRHPQYLGYGLLAAGLALTGLNVVSGALAFLSAVALDAQARGEEAFLREAHGEAYDDYAARVPRYDPVGGLWRLIRGNRASARGLRSTPYDAPRTRTDGASMADVKITVSESGFYKVEGPVELVDPEGRRIETREGKPFYLCRCGRSANKPFCDSSHKAVEWDGALADRSE